MSKLVEVLIIVAGGALGGLVSVIEAWTDPVSYPLTFAKLFALLIIPVVKGGVAAGMGVYLLTTLDSTQMIRAFFFSVACGLTFPTIITKGASVSQSVTSQVASQIISNSASTIKEIKSTGAENAVSAIHDLKSASIQIIEATPKVSESDRKVAATALEQAVSSLGNTATSTGNTKAIEAITDIGALSATRNLHAPTERAISELKALEATPSLGKEGKLKAAAAIQKLQDLRM